MRKKLTKIVLATVLASMPLLADKIAEVNPTKSLFAIEGSYNKTDFKSTGGHSKTDDFGGFGLKIGAQVKHYRIFLSGRMYAIKDFDYAYTYGGEVQYLFTFSKIANFYIGANAGKAVMRQSKDVGTISVDDFYYGGDTGFNIHASELIDVEMGVRAMQINNFDNMATAYVSMIIKYDMD